jgi:beta-glucosidase
VVVLQNGAPVTMPWLKNVKGVLECYLGGQGGSTAIADIIYGHTNPSGKLAETFPIKLEDTPASQWFPMGPKTVEYRESIYVGYRYYDSFKKDVLFPFGYGLSYTQFRYNNLSLQKNVIKDDESVSVSFDITNVGSRSGKETAQLYIRDEESTLFRPEKELKGFAKVMLEPGETQTVTMRLSKRSFAFYDVNLQDWNVESGVFDILIGSSSVQILLQDKITVASTNDSVILEAIHLSTPEYYDLTQDKLKVTDASFEFLLGKPIPSSRIQPGDVYTINSTLGDIKGHPIGAVLYNKVHEGFVAMMGSMNPAEPTSLMMERMVEEMPLRSIALFFQEMTSLEEMEALVDQLNA